MQIKFPTTLYVILAALTLQGCAAAIVGGAAATATIIHDRRTTGVIVEDQSIELKSYDVLKKDPMIKEQTNISVTSYNMVVLLTGQASNENLRRKAEQLVTGVDRVRRVVNEIEIGSTSSIGEDSRDVALTSEVKLKLSSIDIPGFDPLRVKVVTERGTVFLLGLITKQEGDAVTEVVRHISGVRRVVRVFEYI
ncbi:MAG: BON domain-containing protein [Candidatus Thiodiazotropha sp. 'RUGA']|nr:BON domain-containing protein [Candidatus Thiodiazotropha endolucinida]MCG8015247.1 BON domain-containing protein [Candidatus Thiodiazotropha sp. 'RUGA']MCW4230937.1 BON domain-containing protein [Candidatus Thiodiazotropha taylori]